MNKTWITLFAGVFIWSGFEPQDYLTWLLEVFPAILTFLILALTRRIFPLTPLTYWLLLIECIILMIGGHFTYAKVPLFDWISEYLNHGRNNYDKLAHFSQGFVPAITTREILLRFQVVRGDGWLFFLVACVCLAISAFYELIEWWVALLSQQAAEAFLGTQGYIWDTQSDMALALLGAIAAQGWLRKWHDRQLHALLRGH